MLVAVTTDVAQNANYVFMPIAGLILVARLVASRFQPKPFDTSFGVVALSLAVLICRSFTDHYAVKLGTGSDAITAANQGHPFSTDKLSHIQAGTMFSLANRVLETSFWWLQTTLLLLLYRRLVSHIKWTKVATMAAWAFLGLSYIAITVTIFTECHPLHLYWQVDPPPGTCNKAYRTTVLQCTSLIILDIALMAIAHPVLFVKGRSSVQRSRIAGLFALGLLCSVFSAMRMAYIFVEGSSQAGRAFWSGLLVLVSCFVANAPIIYGSITLFTKGNKSSHGDSKYSKYGRATKDKSGLDTKVKITTTVAVISVSEKEHEDERLEIGPVTSIV